MVKQKGYRQRLGDIKLMSREGKLIVTCVVVGLFVGMFMLLHATSVDGEDSVAMQPPARYYLGDTGYYLVVKQVEHSDRNSSYSVHAYNSADPEPYPLEICTMKGSNFRVAEEDTLYSGPGHRRWFAYTDQPVGTALVCEILIPDGSIEQAEVEMG